MQVVEIGHKREIEKTKSKIEVIRDLNHNEHRFAQHTFSAFWIHKFQIIFFLNRGSVSMESMKMEKTRA